MLRRSPPFSLRRGCSMPPLATSSWWLVSVDGPCCQPIQVGCGARRPRSDARSDARSPGRSRRSGPAPRRRGWGPSRSRRCPGRGTPTATSGPGRPARRGRTPAREVSSACRCQTSRDRAVIARSSGASSTSAAATVPVSVAADSCAPCRASPATSQCWAAPGHVPLRPLRLATLHGRRRKAFEPYSPSFTITALM
jgi:hypothetical protein